MAPVKQQPHGGRPRGEDALSARTSGADDSLSAERLDLERARVLAGAVLASRVEHGVSRTRLARELRMPPRRLARLESGECLPTIGDLQQLSEVLGVRFRLDVGPATAGENTVTTRSVVDY